MNGPEIFIDFKASSPGYPDGDTTLGIAVDTPPEGISEFELPAEIIYVAIAGIAIVLIVIVLFLKKSKEPLDDEDEPWEDDDI